MDAASEFERWVGMIARSAARTAVRLTDPVPESIASEHVIAA
jgi:hypothetical protein